MERNLFSDAIQRLLALLAQDMDEERALRSREASDMRSTPGPVK
jgi:hypothetical protein